MKPKLVYVDNFLTGHGHTPTTGNTLVKLFKQEGYTVIPTSNKQNKAIRLADMVITIIANRKKSVVLIATYSTSAFYFACTCASVCRLFNVPYIPCLHGGNLPERIKNSPAIAAKYFSNSFINVAVSGYLKQSMLVNNWKCIEIPNNIQLADYSYKLRQAIKPKLLWVRSFHKIYNPALAIRVLANLRKRYPDANLTMVGPDKDGTLQQCKDLVRQLDLEKYVTFTGLLNRETWTRIAQSHDIFINTTNFDNLPVSVVEGMALGMIVISTNVGGVPFLLEDGKTGLLVKPDDELAFEEAIEKVLANETLSSALSRSARQKAEQFDWSHVRILWNELFTSVAGKLTS